MISHHGASPLVPPHVDDPVHDGAAELVPEEVNGTIRVMTRVTIQAFSWRDKITTVETGYKVTTYKVKSVIKSLFNHSNMLLKSKFRSVIK